MERSLSSLPPKKSGGGSNTITPTKAPPDEILSSLLRLNNHDSFSSIKDESLDIDLSACVTINAGDSAPVLNGNSFSSTDFWRMLDENAQTPQLELSDESLSKMSDTTQEITINSSTGSTTVAIKVNNFEMPFGGDKFLRPNPPISASNALPTLRKTPVKLMPPLESFDHKFLTGIPKDLTITRIERPHNIIKLEPVDQLPDIIIEEEKIQGPVQTEKTIAEVSAPPPESIHKCMTCNGLLLHTTQEQTTHELASHRILHVCGTCDREFEQEAGLKKHLKSHRSVEARKDSWRKCPDCGKSLKLGSMWMHRKIHSDNKKYACDICGQKFVQKINLTHHSRVHTAEKPYECPECQKRFQERSHLQRHQKYHAQTRSYRCEKCGKMYKTERCLKVHNLVHLEQRPFACNVCDKSFISNSKLKQHSNIHTGERPFKCNYCPRDFTNFPNWLKHTRRRHKVDHKTGQQLENIPSYCSKKSTKTTKPAKVTNGDDQLSKPKVNQATKTTKDTTIKTTTQITTLSEASKQNAQVKVTTPIGTTVMKQQTLPKIGTQKLTTINYNGLNANTPTSKLVKVKRERKQSTPRQVQKSPKSAATALGVTIKQEHVTDTLPTNVKTTQTDFPDLHGLSLTSAEELIMEQALEMEECGLYDAPISSIGETDNAISSDQFKIKSEFNETNIKDELAFKESNKRLICSSLESSPYSSPASVELTSATTTTKLPALSPTNSATGGVMAPPPLTTFYMQPFQLNTVQGTTMLSRLCNNGSTTSICDTTNTATTTQTSVQLLPQMLQTHTQMHTQAQNGHNSGDASMPMSMQMPTTQAFLNHIFLPMTVNMQNKQVLPSVETLLFSAHANASLFAADVNGRTCTSAQQQPPPPTTSSLSTQRNLS